MIATADLLVFASASLVMVLTPGPNMIYLVSRSLCQGRRAGLLSLAGVSSAFVVHLLAACLGLSAVFIAVPAAWTALKWLGAGYLLWLAWQSFRPGARSPFEARALPPDPPGRLYRMGFLTNLLNPKAAVFYLSIFPQFIVPGRGSLLGQGLVLGLTQIAISFVVNLAFILSAATLAAWFARSPGWLRAQRYLMGSILAGLAGRLALEQQRVG